MRRIELRLHPPHGRVLPLYYTPKKLPHTFYNIGQFLKKSNWAIRSQKIKSIWILNFCFLTNCHFYSFFSCSLFCFDSSLTNIFFRLSVKESYSTTTLEPTGMSKDLLLCKKFRSLQFPFD